MDRRDLSLAEAIKTAGSITRLAVALGVSVQAVSQWKICPAKRVLDVERLTGLPREILRPDLYPLQERRNLGVKSGILSNAPECAERYRCFCMTASDNAQSPEQIRTEIPRIDYGQCTCELVLAEGAGFQPGPSAIDPFCGSGYLNLGGAWK
jgi:DNA-binding transcriptional regulator YdaS (Cro superfamily)